MKRILITIVFIISAIVVFGQAQTINNGESGLSVRTKLNTMFAQLYDLHLTAQFSTDGSSWDNVYTAGDSYMRLSDNLGVSWTSKILLFDGINIVDSLNLNLNRITNIGAAINNNDAVRLEQMVDSMAVATGHDSIVYTNPWLKVWLNNDVIDSTYISDLDSSFVNITVTDTLFFDGDTIIAIQQEDAGLEDNYILASKAYVDSVTIGAGGYTDEQAQDAVGAMVDDGTLGDIIFTYTDATPSLKGDVEDDSHNHIIANVDNLQDTIDVITEDLDSILANPVILDGGAGLIPYVNSYEDSLIFDSDLSRAAVLDDIDSTTVQRTDISVNWDSIGYLSARSLLNTTAFNGLSDSVDNHWTYIDLLVDSVDVHTDSIAAISARTLTALTGETDPIYAADSSEIIRVVSGTFGADNRILTSNGTGNFSQVTDWQVNEYAGFSYEGTRGSWYIGKNAGAADNEFIGTANGNFGIGDYALYANKTGDQNVAIGTNALLDLNDDNASDNTAIGYGALANLKTGYDNTGIGYWTGYPLTTGNKNILIGHSAGRFYGVSSNNITPDYSVYIGADTKAAASNGQNEIVIGYNTTGNGSNTVTIGNSSITDNYFSGAVIHDAATADTESALLSDVKGTVNDSLDVIRTTIAGVVSGDTSPTNEGDLTVGAGASNTSIINSNTSGSTGVTLSGSTNLNITESGNTITFTPTGLQTTLTTGNLTESVAGLQFNATRQVIGGAAALSLSAGYMIPTTTNSTNWTAAYNDKITTLAFSGTTTKTLTLTQQDAGTISNTFTDLVNDADANVANEGILGVGAGASNTSVILSNTSGASGVTLTASTGLSISESTSSNGGNITLTNTVTNTDNQELSWNGSTGEITIEDGNTIDIDGRYLQSFTEVDGSTSNELQTLSIDSTGASAPRTFSLTLSDGNSVYFNDTGGSGSGDVSKVGTPVNNQVGVWTGDGTLEGDVDLTFDGNNLTVDGALNLTGTTSAKINIKDIEGTPSTPNAGYGQFYVNSKVPYFIDEDGTSYDLTSGGGGGGAPTDATYLTTTTNGTLTNEIVVGATPSGDLGGTWSNISVDNDSHTHSSSTISDKGATTQVLYNNSGTISGDADLTFNGTNLTVGGYITSDESRVQSLNTNSSTVTLNYASGANAIITVTSNTSFTLSLSAIPTGKSGNITIVNTTAGGAMTFSGYTNKINPSIGAASNIVTISGSNKIDVYSYYYDGTRLIWNGQKDYN